MTPAERLTSQLWPHAEELCSLRGWNLGKALGAGATAATFEVGTDDGLRALKLYAPRFLTGKAGDQTRRRLGIILNHLKGHNCPNLVKIYEGDEHNKILYLLMQRAPGKCLADVLKLVPRQSIRSIVAQVASAAKFLEDLGLCHRDIKAENIVVSEDFAHAILLDLGVVRWLDDEAGAGTDQEGQLPFVATARYSSPEYMFRLMSSGRELWRALTFYQLGGLVHDLITKELLFEDVVAKARENRYLIAYAVATRVPQLPHSADIPLDLVLLAQRALEKDATRRLASITWEHFLGEDSRRRTELILGLGVGASSPGPTDTVVPNWARELEQSLNKKLSEMGIHCEHPRPEIMDGSSARLRFIWTPPAAALPADSSVAVTFLLTAKHGCMVLDSFAELSCGSAELQKTVSKPVVSLAISLDQFPPTLVEHAFDAFLQNSAQVLEEHAGRLFAAPSGLTS